MTTPTADHHDHPGFEVPAGYVDPLDRPVDHDLLGHFMGAAYDGCTTCQDPLLTLITADPSTTTRLVELACIAVDGSFGGLPANMYDDTVAGTSSVEFRRLARAGLGGNNQAILIECEQMSVDERRAAANTAADTLIGMFALGGPA